jgi:hypothetical protein
MSKYEPPWFRHLGPKTRVDESCLDKKQLAIIVGTAALKISRLQAEIGSVRMWKIEWNILHSNNSAVTGSISFTDKELAIAFRLAIADEDEQKLNRGLVLRERYEGDRASQGKFLGWHNCLNIPCPGSGGDGDPNFSVEIDDRIQDAVEQLLK